MFRKRASHGKRSPGQLEATKAQPLDIDLELYVWSELRALAVKQHLHTISELAGLVGGIPVGILIGSIISLFQFSS